jgi:predicted kinase
MTVHMLVGLSGSGKTRFRKRMQNLKGWVAVSRDDIRRNVFGVEFDPKLEPHVNDIYWEIVYEVLIGEHANPDRDVCLDCTHLTKESRQDASNVVQGLRHKLVVHEFVVDPEICWQRKKYTRAGTVRSGMSREEFDAAVKRYEPFDPDTEYCDEYIVHKGRKRD